MPPRSTGCFTCRKRKIRCDEGRPGCQRCALHRVPCPGYRAEKAGGIEFEDQTMLTVRRARQAHSSSSSSSNKSSATPPSDAELNRGGQKQIQPFEVLSFATSPVTITSPESNRKGLYGTFLSTYLPNKIGCSSAHFSFLMKVAETSPDEPAVRHAFDALSLVQVEAGSANRDKALVHQSVESYSKALASLARAISVPGNVANDSLIAAVSVLSICEFFGEISHSGKGWIGHVQGLHMLLAARGPDSLKSELSLLLLCNSRHSTLATSLIARKAAFLDTPKWRHACFRTPVQDESTHFYDIAIQLPGLLERHDKFSVSEAGALDKLDRLIADCERIQLDMRNWLAGWEVNKRIQGIEIIETIPITEFEIFPERVSDRTLTEGYNFPTFMAGYMHSQYWVCMHYLLMTLRHLYNLRSVMSPGWFPSAEQEVKEDEILADILSLCKCIPFFVEPQSASTGHVSIFLPLRLVAVYFRSHRNWQWLQWCGNVKDNVFDRGLSQPNVGDMIPPGELAGQTTVNVKSAGIVEVDPLGYPDDSIGVGTTFTPSPPVLSTSIPLQLCTPQAERYRATFDH